MYTQSLSAGVFVLVCTLSAKMMADDPHQWLEEVENDKVLAWVRQQNAASKKVIEAHPDFTCIEESILEILQSDDRIPYFRKRGEWLYNFWQDATHTRGIWRRTTLEEYKKEKPLWESVLDVDKLSEIENENWVFKGADVLEPDFDRAIIRLSRGGKDASVYREFDLRKKRFLDRGFNLPEAKSDLAWINRNTTLVATDFGKGTLSSSGYPRIVKLWKRGQSLDNARMLFEGESKDVGSWPFTLRNIENTYVLVRRSKTFYKGEYHLLVGKDLQKLNLPDDSRIADIFNNLLLVQLKSDWTVAGKTLSQGALISLPLDELVNGKPRPRIVYAPDANSTISSVDVTADAVLINTLNNVTSKLLCFKLDNDRWSSEPIAKSLQKGVLYVSNASHERQDFTISFQNMLTPDSLFYLTQAKAKPSQLKNAPARFDTSSLVTSQQWAKSKDGTKIPYFVVGPEKANSANPRPTLLYAYGGFEISMRPWYNATVGKSWLERGGTYVLANIRGGGEFGPTWHQSALKTNRNKAYEDFIAVAEDLVNRGFTKPRHLGIKGGSNGGLLTGVAFTHRPDLFNAVVCQVPLLDMKRYTKLLAGHSWIAEYGDPDQPEIWKFWKNWSPYHNVIKAKKYPTVLFTTSTKDDRVHPGHARKMVARMKAQGHPVLYYENIEGGHAGAANLKQRAYGNALAYSYLLQQLK